MKIMLPKEFGMINTCEICGSSPLGAWNELYLECSQCGHHIASQLSPSVIINEDLDLEKMKRRDSLDRFKTRTLIANSPAFECLVDIGSGSGKFLYQNQKYFKTVIGIEVSPECVEFSKKNLDLQILAHYPAAPKASCVSFWHSMEHLTLDQIQEILQAISNHSGPDVRLIISVPSAQSLLHRSLKNLDPYYDSSSHYHEFSHQSLSLLLEKSGFQIEKSLFSLAYSLFGWVQGLSNLFHPVRNYFYYRFRRNNSVVRHPMNDVLSIVLFVGMLPLGLLLALLEIWQPQKSCVLNVIAKKI
jgi:hypothetical protein